MRKPTFVAILLALAAGASMASAQGDAAAADREAQVGKPRPGQTAQRAGTPARPAAQGRLPGRPGSIEASAGGAWLAPGALGSSTATLTANSSATPFTYFDTSARMGGAGGVDARLAYNLTRRVAVEGGLLYSRPSVNFTVSRDAENTAGFTGSGERLSQYFIDGSLLLYLPKLAFAQGRGRAFVEGGGGYLRQLHAGRLNVDSGSVYNGGAGFKYYFRPRPKGTIKGFGIRADLRAYYRRGGYSFDGGNTWTVGLGAGAIVAF